MAAETTAASTSERVTSTPTEAASGSFSRNAIMARPRRERTSRAITT